MGGRARALFDRLRLALVIGAVLPAALAGCSTAWQAKFVTPEHYADIDHEHPFLKAHLKDGRVVVFDRWKITADNKLLNGHGILYNAQRAEVTRGHQELPLDRIALFETNQPRSVVNRAVVVMGVITGASLAVNLYCIANPKACYGSCPTFFTDDGTGLKLQAEGFSSSVAASLEQTDVDALAFVRPAGRRLELLMTNDALETHRVRSVSLLVAPRPAHGRVYRQGERYFQTGPGAQPLSCESRTGDCLSLVRARDDLEYLSAASERDLAEHERVELTFAHPTGSLGLVVVARNSLMNTFLFYQTLAWMGLDADEYFLRLERAGSLARRIISAPARLLGNVEIEAQTASGWERAGAFDELGPIAREVQLVRLPEDLPPGPVRLRLVMARGYYKIDRLSLVVVGAEVRPRAIPISEVRRGALAGPPDEAARAALLDPDAYLTTFPGDAYGLVFDLPAGPQELFLVSRGYYYEWIREQWLPERDPEQVARILFEPEDVLRELAPAYKRLEPSMERAFWQSRIGR